MKSKNSLQGQGEALSDGVGPRILVSYYRTSMEIEEYHLISRLITDLWAVGIDVLIDEIQDINSPFTAYAQPYNWVLLVQTKDVSSNALVRERLAQTLARGGRQYLQGILHVFVSTPRPQAPLTASDTPITFNADSDYQRAFAGIMLAIHPTNQTRLYGVERGAATPVPAPRSLLPEIIADAQFHSRRVTGLRHPLYTAGIVLTVLILLVVIVIHSFIISTVKTTTTGTTTDNHHTNAAVTKTTIVRQHASQAPLGVVTTGPRKTLFMQVTSRTPTIADSLQRQSANQWDIMQQQGVSCAFSNGTYHISVLPPAQPSKRHACLAEGPVFANLALQVDMKLLQGDVGGILFRANGHSSYYWFALDSNGCYRLVLLLSGKQPLILSNDKLSCLQIPMQNTNQLTALAQGSNIYLYINGNFIRQFSDPSLTKGEIGLLAIDRKRPTDVAFSNLKVWQLA